MNENEADILDVAANLAELENAKGLERWRESLQTGETPDIDENGVRYCLDCAGIIPPERIAVALPSPVRCVECESRRELLNKRQRVSYSSAGILNALDRANAEEKKHSLQSLRTAADAFRDSHNASEHVKDPTVYL